ncbi:hypothetical protein DPMN_057762 [Dreissena polymorpha]|uniref:Uncharacterized protein n=1 Tax=Dreissena polymorpha TaxID=45954 RepID=A0A9D4C0I5_DREPO|nr:hypothetical protein DPMN_057762 [Dreissena polymorpha]
MIGQKLKTAPSTGGHVFQRIETTFKLNQDIIKTNILTNFEIGRDFIGTKLLTKFHEDGTRNQMLTDGRTYDGQRPVTKAQLSNQFAHMRGFHDDWAKNVTSRVKLPTINYFQTQLSYQGNKFSDQISCNWAKNVTSRRKNAPPTGGHVFSLIPTIFKLVRDINKSNVLTNFHDDWAKIVTSRVLTRKTAPPTGGHVFQRTGTTFELNQHIIKTNILTNFELDRDFMGTKLLTKFHEDQTINVASRVFTNQMWTTDGWTDGQMTDKDRSQKLT